LPPTTIEIRAFQAISGTQTAVEPRRNTDALQLCNSCQKQSRKYAFFLGVTKTICVAFYRSGPIRGSESNVI
jgi:hypothetical protein